MNIQCNKQKEVEIKRKEKNRRPLELFVHPNDHIIFFVEVKKKSVNLFIILEKQKAWQTSLATSFGECLARHHLER